MGKRIFFANCVLVVVFLVLISSSAYSASPTSTIGYVNLQRALIECDAGIKGKELLKQLAVKLEDEVKEMQLNKDSRLAERYNKYSKTFYELKGRVERIIIEGLRTTVEEIYKEDGYKGIYDTIESTDALTWRKVKDIPKGGDDITGKVIDKFNMEKMYIHEIDIIMDDAFKTFSEGRMSK